ncbi:response regulator [Cohnella soli]|uniref:Response regulator n=1 Tax=Cohnella soli TaxID=425005 RepID=A0ABW0I476_9BACL
MQIMVVDDEQAIREHLVGLKEWENIGCTVVGEAGNGSEALKSVPDCRPDLIITDIRMPVMDGIQLAETVRTLYPSVQVIFISAYDDFVYAKQAMKLGVVDFITKPIVVGELLNSVELLRQGIHRADRDGELFQENMIRLQLSGKQDGINEEELRNLQPLLDRQTVLISVEIDNMGSADTITNPLSLLTLKEAVCNAMSRHSYPFWTYFGQKGLFIILFQPDGVECDIERDVLIIARNLTDRCKTMFSYSISIVISGVLASLTDLRRGMLHIEECRDYRMLLGEGSIIAYDSLSSIQHGGMCAVTAETAELMGYLRRGEKERIPPYFRAVYRDMLSNGLKKIHVQHYALDLLERAERVMTEYRISIRHEEQIEDRKKILSYDTLSELMKFLEIRLSEVADRLSCYSEQSVSGWLKKMMHYIDTHYQEEITLVSLSKHVHMNHAYLCRLIKKETGTNFRELLWQIRIEKAKELLADSETKAFEVAYQVGFKDPSHFSQLFKRFVGVTPTEFRAMLG